MENNTELKNEEPTVTSNSETVAATETTPVTSSSPTTSAASAFQPFQQLHEAVLAAVNSHNVLPGSLFSAAVAAAAANGNVTIHPQPFDQLEQPIEQQRSVLSEAENAKKESVRASNRERKKKWRLHNEERNKDNDLRCRVNKRAQKLYGLGDSPAKQQWINEEFEKRRQKRMEKERRKHIVNNVLSVPGATDSTTTATTNTDNNNGISNIVNNQMSAYYTPLPQIDTATAAKLLDFPTDLQRQLLEQLNNSMMAFTNGIQQPPQTEETTDTNFTNDTKSSETSETPVDTAAAVAAAAQAANDALQQVIAQGLSTTASTTSSNHNSPLPFTEETKTEEGVKEEGKREESQKEEGEKKEDEVKKETEINKEEGTEEKKPEYPMDAVLTLMQLNAGWRQ